MNKTDKLAHSIVHDPEFEEHREHIQPLANRVLELRGELLARQTELRALIDAAGTALSLTIDNGGEW